jgi:hypothetical protein
MAALAGRIRPFKGYQLEREVSKVVVFVGFWAAPKRAGGAGMGHADLFGQEFAPGSRRSGENMRYSCCFDCTFIVPALQ